MADGAASARRRSLRIWRFLRFRRGLKATSHADHESADHLESKASTDTLIHANSWTSTLPPRQVFFHWKRFFIEW